MSSALASSANDVAEQLTGRRYISFSSISTYLRCPLQYRFKYIDNLPEQTVSSALVFGTSIHRAVEHFFHESLAGNPRPDLDILLDVFQEGWRDRD